MAKKPSTPSTKPPKKKPLKAVKPKKPEVLAADTKPPQRPIHELVKQGMQMKAAREARAAARAMRRGHLTDQQKVFINEYMVDMDAKNAGLRSGYAESYSSKVVQFWVGPSRENCPPKFRHVWDAANAAKLRRLQRVEFDADKVLESLTDVATADVSTAFDADGYPLPIHLMPPAVRKLIAGIEVEGTKIPKPLHYLIEGIEDKAFRKFIYDCIQPRITKIKFYNRLDAVGMVGKHVKVQAFRENINNNNTNTTPPQARSEEDLQDLLKLGRQLTLVEALASGPVNVTTEGDEHADTPTAAGHDAGTVPAPAEPDPGTEGVHPPAGSDGTGAGGEARS